MTTYVTKIWNTATTEILQYSFKTVILLQRVGDVHSDIIEVLQYSMKATVNINTVGILQEHSDPLKILDTVLLKYF